MPTKKDFESMARVIAAHVEKADSEQDPAAFFLIKGIAIDMASVFAKENPRFDIDIFLKACNVRNA